MTDGHGLVIKVPGRERRLPGTKEKTFRRRSVFEEKKVNDTLTEEEGLATLSTTKTSERLDILGLCACFSKPQYLGIRYQSEHNAARVC